MKKLFYFLSKTDADFISLPSTTSFRSQQIVKGLLVLISGLFGGAVAAYAIWLVSTSYLFAAVCGFVYGVTTMFLNRELVSLGDSMTTPFSKFRRSFLALLWIIVSSLLFSVPLAMRLEDPNIPNISEGKFFFMVSWETMIVSLVTWTFCLTALLLVGIQCAPMFVGWLSTDNKYADLIQTWRAQVAEMIAKQIRDYSFEQSVESRDFFEKLLSDYAAARSESDAYPGLSLPSFGSGFASAMDWFGDLSPTIEEFRGGKRTLDEARDAAIARDWAVIGQDLQKVLDKHGEGSAQPNA